MGSRCLFGILLVSLVGCGTAYVGDEAAVSTSMPAMEAESGSDATVAEDASGAGKMGPAVANRKIIYTASVDLVVTDFSATDKKLAELVSQAEGYVSEFREDRRYGGQLGGRWIVRIPVGEFSSFLKQVLDLGVPMMRQIDAQDVTEQFVDLTARLENKRRLEERVLKLLEEKTAALKEVIEVESELSRVREEIELLEGKLRYMSDRIDMTTITITAREEREHIPVQAPTFVGKIKKVFFDSLYALKKLLEGLTLIAVGAIPWLVVAVLALTPVLILLRRRRR